MKKRTEKLKQFCEASGLKKYVIAQQHLGVPPQMLTYLLNYDIDELVKRIDRLKVA